MPVLIVIIGVIMLLLLITVGKINASISFVIVSLFVGLSMGLSLDDTVEALFKEYFNLTLKETPWPPGP